MLAYKGFEGIKRLRRHFSEFAKKHKVAAPAFTTTKLDKTEMAQHGFRDEILAYEDLQQLIDHYQKLRDACAHFFVGSRGSGARQHLQLSSTLVHTCGKVAALMLVYMQRELAHLKDYHRKYFANITNAGMLLPMESARDRFMVVCPDDEATAPPDEFNR